MNPKLRIMTIRLMKKMVEHPGYAAWIGIEGSMTRVKMKLMRPHDDVGSHIHLRKGA